MQDFEAQREEIKNRNSEDYNVLKIQLEGIIEELERHFEQVCGCKQTSSTLLFDWQPYNHHSSCNSACYDAVY
jgi:hypothetical protein